MSQNHRYNEEADKALDDLYKNSGANSTSKKIYVLELKLNDSDSDSFYAFGGEMTEAIKLGCLEHEYLANEGLIDVALV